MTGRSHAHEPQECYARWLHVGTLIVFVFATVALALYVSGLLPAYIALEELPRLWMLPADELRRAAHAPGGSEWLHFLRYGDYLNVLAIAAFSLLSAVCTARVVPAFLRSGERLHALLAALVFLVLAAAAFTARAQDYDREARWKAEVLGNLVVGEAVELALPNGRTFLGLYTPGEKTGIVLVHGIGVHPDHGLIGILRVALADRGFATLSIQMPVLAADTQPQDYYPALFPEAAARIAAAMQWLSPKNPKLVLVSHSLGSWMSEYYLRSGGKGFAAWVCMGRGGALAPVSLPVLDVYGEKDNLAVIESATARRAVLEKIRGSKQVIVPGADHFYTGKEDELARLVAEFASSR